MKFLFSKTTATVLLATGVVAGGMVSSANAAAFSAGSCDVTDITLTDGSGAAAADACEGAFEGNDSAAEMNNNNVFDINTWDQVNKIDVQEGSSMLSSDLFKISRTDEDWKFGTIEFLQDINQEFSFNLKASTFWSAYSFDGVTAGEIFNFDTTGVAQKNNGTAPGLSHASIYFHQSDSNPQEVPEPTVIGGLLMLGAGLASSRRRKA